MKSTLNKIGTVLFALVLIISLTNCKAIQNANNKQKGAVIGAAGGAVGGVGEAGGVRWEGRVGGA